MSKRVGRCCLFVLMILGLLASASASAQPSQIFRDGFESGSACLWRPLGNPGGFTIPVNPTFSKLLNTSSACGVFETAGSKTPGGLAQSSRAMRLAMPSGQAVVIEFGPDGKPARITVEPDGAVFDLGWTSETTFVLTALAPSGALQVTTEVDLTQPPAALPPAPPPASRRRSRVDRELANRGSIPLPNPTIPAWQEGAASPFANTFVQVQRCGRPVTDAVVYLRVTTTSSPLLLTAEGQTTPGTYPFTIPNPNSVPTSTLQEICSSVADALGVTCAWVIDPLAQSGSVPLVCGAVAAAVDLVIGGPTGEGAAIFGYCEVGFAAASTYCDTIGWSPQEGIPSIADVICEGVGAAQGFLFPPQVAVEARVYAPGSGSFSQIQNAPAPGPYPSFSFVLPASDPAVESFTISPPDPAPGQPYTVSAFLTCLPAAATVEVSIEGTDGYSDAVTCDLSSAGGCQLVVPGAEAGIRDTLRLRVDGVLLRTTGIVF